jgi:branched-chain amino acid transport system substrate-binding protein
MKLIRTAILFATLVMLGCGSGESIKVGLVLPLTGPVATFGESARDGALLAFEEINAAGGVKGRQLEVLLVDDHNDPVATTAAATRLVETGKVTAILGSVSTACSEPLAAWCEEAGVPMIAPSSTNPFVTVARDGVRRGFVFRACFTDSFQGAVAARFARRRMNAASAAVLYGGDDEYSAGLAGIFAAAFEALGGQVVGSEPYDRSSVDLAPAIERLRAARPDVLFLPDYYTRVGGIAREAWQLGLRAELLGGDGWDSPEMLELAGDAIRGGYFTSHFAPDDPRPEVHDWVVRFQARYGRVPDALAALGYDAVRLLGSAFERAETLDRAGVRDALAATAGFVGVTGVISLDERGNPVKDAVVRQFDVGGPRYVMTELP